MCSCKQITNLFMKTYRTESWKLRTLSQVVETKPKKTKKSNSTHSKELDAYLSSSTHLRKIKHSLPSRCLKRNRKVPDDLYLVDSIVGKTIANAILPHIKKNNAQIVETNPGFGFITKRLLEAGVRKIHAYEPTVHFRDNLFELNKQYPNKLLIYNKDFFSIWKLYYQDRYDNGDRVKNMLKDIEAKDWDNEIAMNIIGILPNSNFIRHLILSLVFQYGIMTHGRCNLYICVPPFLYLQWTAQSTDGFQIYRPSSVLLQIFCDFLLIEKIPRKCFLPWDSLMKEKRSYKIKYPHYFVDSEYMYLIKITFKPLPVTFDKLQPLWFFVRHLMVSRKNQVIPMLEKWIPGCGWNLITADPNKNVNLYPDINIYTRIGDMSPSQILKLFQTFSSWPEYTESSFLASMESALLKMEHSTDDGLDSHVKDDEPHEDVEIKENEILDR